MHSLVVMVADDAFVGSGMSASIRSWATGAVFGHVVFYSILILAVDAAVDCRPLWYRLSLLLPTYCTFPRLPCLPLSPLAKMPAVESGLPRGSVKSTCSKPTRRWMESPSVASALRQFIVTYGLSLVRLWRLQTRPSYQLYGNR